MQSLVRLILLAVLASTGMAAELVEVTQSMPPEAMDHQATVPVKPALLQWLWLGVAGVIVGIVVGAMVQQRNRRTFPPKTTKRTRDKSGGLKSKLSSTNLRRNVIFLT